MIACPNCRTPHHGNPTQCKGCGMQLVQQGTQTAASLAPEEPKVETPAPNQVPEETKELEQQEEPKEEATANGKNKNKKK